MATILIVDDDLDSLNMLQTLIRVELGFDVITAHSGDEALKLAPQADAIITDIVMPIMDGLQLCRALNRREDTKNIPVILMTSFLGPDITDQIKSMKLGIFDFLVKPLKKEELIHRLNIMLRVKDAEMRLREAQLPEKDQMHLLLAAFEVTTEGMTITGSSGKWVFVNQAEADMFGYPVSEIMSLQTAELYNGESFKKIQEEVIPSLKKKGHWAGELMGKTKKGKPFPVILNLTSIKDSRNRLLGIMALTRDISEKKKAEEDLKQRSWELLSVNRHLQEAYDKLKDTQDALIQAERLKTTGIVAGGLAHDIKNLISALQGGIEIVDHCLAQKKLDKLDEGWEMLKRGNQRVATLVEDLLYCSREVKPEFRLHDITKLIREEAALLGEKLKAGRIDLQLVISPDIPKFYFDDKIMQRCVSNLLINAIDAVEKQPNPRVTVSALPDPRADNIIIVVEDNGCGMEEATLDKIFELLFTTKNKGIGMGLAITKKGISEHGGQLDVTSRKDQGTKFTIALPIRRNS